MRTSSSGIRRPAVTPTTVGNLLRTEIPGVMPARLPASGTVRWGHGVLVCGVNVLAFNSIVVTHGLGRRIQAATAKANGGGSAFTPKLMFGTTINTPVQVNLIGDETMIDAVVYLE